MLQLITQNSTNWQPLPCCDESQYLYMCNPSQILQLLFLRLLNHLHNAVMHEENEEMGENLVSEEFQKGYMYKDGVLRHSMVKVVN